MSSGVAASARAASHGIASRDNMEPKLDTTSAASTRLNSVVRIVSYRALRCTASRAAAVCASRRRNEISEPARRWLRIAASINGCKCAARPPATIFRLPYRCNRALASRASSLPASVNTSAASGSESAYCATLIASKPTSPRSRSTRKRDAKMDESPPTFSNRLRASGDSRHAFGDSSSLRQIRRSASRAIQ